MQRISITNPQNVIDGTAKKYYFRLHNTGGPKGDKGDKGDTGATGPQGPQGNAATVSVGSTTTLPVGYDATVTNSGSIYNAVLDFGIPQGPQGPQGAKGDKGDTGAKGDTGPRGPQGERGTNATVYVGTTTTTNPGTQARVYNSGTDSNAVLNFEIPRGDVGPQPELVQTTGTSTTKAMSQNATTVALATKQNTIDSSNKLSADLVDDTSTTNKFVTASDKATWNAKQNALTAGDNITISGDTISTPAIVPEVVAELPAIGDEGKLYLTPKAHTTQTATGNPITATVAEEAGKIESFQLDGDTFQQSYTGKNLFNKNNPNMFVGYVGWNGAINSTSADRMIYIPCEPNTTYSIQKPVPTTNPKFRVAVSSDVPTNGGTATVLTNDSYMSLGEATVTTREDSAYLMVYIWVNSSDMTLDEVLSGIQIEVGSSVSSFEPYVGRQASPNPEYPQPIQTVTGKQTVKVLGKNLLNITSPKREVTNAGLHITIADDGKVTIDGTSTDTIWPDFIWGIQNNTANHNSCKYYFPKALEAATFSIKIVNGTVTDSPSISVMFNDDSGKNANIRLSQPQAKTVTGVNGINRAYLNGARSGTTFNNFQFYLQIESGTSATEVVPYSELDFEIDLGDIELCRLGTYQDYIWKDGDSWKLHKAVGKAELWKGTNWRILNTTTPDEHRFSVKVSNTDTPTSGNSSTLVLLNSNYWSACTRLQTFQRTQGIAVTGASDFSVESFVAYVDSLKTSDVDGWKAWLTANMPVVYYQSTTPTDTTITDTNLIAQLEAVRTASLENGTNTITNTATGSNLAGDMEIGYYGYNPTNRYDKFIWLDLNNAYEQLNNPDTSSTLSTLSTRSLGATTEQPTVTRSLETETITLKKGETEPIEDKTELPTILDEEAEETEETETTEPEESDGTDER